MWSVHFERGSIFSSFDGDKTMENTLKKCFYINRKNCWETFYRIVGALFSPHFGLTKSDA